MRAAGRLAVVLAVVVTAAARVRMNLVGSVARGFYWSLGGTAAKGELVVVCPMTSMWSRFWGEAGGRCSGARPLAKRVAGVGGDRVCVVRGKGGCGVFVNGRAVGQAVRLGQCRMKGCGVLREGEVWVVGDARESLDSRVFGSVRRGDLEARLLPLATE